MASIETVQHTVKDKDNLWNIVKAHGFPSTDWKKIYEAPYNQQLRNARPDPNVIMPGDVVALPKYKPSDLIQIVSKISGAQTKLDELGKKRAKLQDDIKRVQKEREPDLKKIEQLQTKSEELVDLAWDAAQECDDMYSCMGGGMAHKYLAEKAAAASKEADKITKKLDAGGTKQALEKMNKQLDELAKDEAKLQAEVRKQSDEWKKAAAQPY